MKVKADTSPNHAMCAQSDVGVAARVDLVRVRSIPFFLLADPCQLEQLATAPDWTLMTQW